jgi:hypothetical protein
LGRAGRSFDRRFRRALSVRIAPRLRIVGLPRVLSELDSLFAGEQPVDEHA